MSNAAKIHNGVERQLQQWRTALAAGDQRLGWKIGFNRAIDQQKFDLPSPMIGYLTAKRRLASGGSYTFKAGATILLEAEIALLIGHDVAAGATLPQARSAIQGYAAALELVDTSRTRSNDIAEILSGNLFHEAVLIGHATTISNTHFNAALKINGNEVRRFEPDRLADDFGAIVKVVADMLGLHGEQLQAGDWIISGAATTPIEVHAGDDITLEMEPLGNLTLTITEGK